MSKANSLPLLVVVVILANLFGTVSQVYSQVVEIDSTYLEQTNYILAPLDKSKIPKAILYGRMFDLASLERYTGITGTDTSEVDHFHQAYYEIYNSSYNVTGWKTPDQLDSDLDILFNSNIHPIGILYYDYNTIDTNAIANNQFYLQNGQLHDVINRTTSPYLTKTTFVASPLGPSQVLWETGTHTFKLDPLYFLGNKPLNVNNVTIDFNDGVGLRTLALNSSVTVNYTTSGPKYVTINVNLVGGAVLKGTAILDIRTGRPAPQLCNGVDTIQIKALPFNANQYGGASNEQGNGVGYIYFSNANCTSKKVTKPIIFLDGFDPKQKKKKDERTPQKIWDDFINKRVLVNGVEVRLGDKLRADGYDIIIYDYDDGGDLIEKNALGVVQLFKRIYTKYQTSLLDDYVVIGPSYGSLVAQYALTYCEKYNIPHHTRLYISFDGPQQGANVPVGLQQFLDFFTKKGIVAWLKPNLKNGLHNVPAAKQMLVHHSNANSETPMPDNFRNIYKANLTAIGEYPTKCRKVAIINGSSVAAANTFLAPCGEMVHYSLKKLLSSAKKLNWNAYSSAKTSRCESINMLTDGYFLRWILNRPTSYIRYTQPAPNNQSYDVAPGGYFGDPFGDYEGTVKFYSNLAFGFIRKKEFRHNVNPTFMPSVSSADIRLQSFNLNFPFNNLNLACEGITPFDRVYAPLVNEEHVSITSNNVDWFEKEIKGVPPPVPNGSVYTVTINGPSEIPCSTPVIFTATANSGVSTQYIWSFPSPNVTIVSGQGTSSVQVRSVDATVKDFTATVSVNTKCGTGSATKATHSGAPVIPTISNIIVSPTGAVNATVNTNASPPYKWYVDGVLAKTGTLKNEQYIPAGSCGYHMLTVDVTNNCGTTNSGTRPEYLYNRNCSSFTVYPNPSDTELTVKLAADSDANASMARTESAATTNKLPYQIRLFDKNMLEVRKILSNGEDVRISTIGLESGIYYLQVKNGKLIEVSNVLIQH
ncbi:hypothetical protein C3K47_19110 [Solitalea longa]|uniref:PKD-like domain-containing protein n=1 Tax=Solitalea longa TaxID=2079460 RepID=A0A2S4ZX79_9SPHI|nr:T9SS type A sorting domain-containing protein [Solitalea longa]POY34659.1 hypothetical protein C3K47_19110 [Solitalea longa]